MTINEKDFESFITVKQKLDKTSVHHCMIRIGVLQRWFADKELTKETVELFFYEQIQAGKKNNTLNTPYQRFALRPRILAAGSIEVNYVF